MSILSLAVAAKAKTALAYCCVGALSIGANQVYEKQVKPQSKARVHKVVQRHFVATPPAIVCPPPQYPAIVGAGERIDLAAVNSLPIGGFGMTFINVPARPTAIQTAIHTEVPEPAMLGIFGLGFAGLAGLRAAGRRRRQNGAVVATA